MGSGEVVRAKWWVYWTDEVKGAVKLRLLPTPSLCPVGETAAALETHKHRDYRTVDGAFEQVTFSYLPNCCTCCQYAC